MLKAEKIDAFVQQIRALLPKDLRQTKDDLERNIKAAVKASLTRMDLVTREEYDIQRELLVKTRCLVDDLEEKVKKLEEDINKG